MYGRLDMNSYFPTTVTNMDPTAKQSKVLNPYVCLYPTDLCFAALNIDISVKGW